ncbi:Putative glucuronosyltransferase PGSIP7 [Zea mays]|uniref:Putative glucuronosyltransferase PGSIP7 n=1 Tax=Zea mays TaxID=4577 RepID=A0A1D6E3U2_MAIZE|nr:Putative glucuronosyltransferase PGSIP7 [Zea mays]
MGWSAGLWWLLAAVWVVVAAAATAEGEVAVGAAPRRHAYASMMYMGTPRDYEFYVATRVMMLSLRRLSPNADRVVIASLDVPPLWVQALKNDGVKVVSVKNLKNPYEKQENFNRRFKLTLNKLSFCASGRATYFAGILLQIPNYVISAFEMPSMDVFKNMLHELAVGRENPDGADQGFLASYFPDLLDQPMFHPPANGTKLWGTYRLPLGYQMDASYYYLKLRWSIPCGPNSVITFPSAPWFKPWYWWSWPVLPLGLSWHEQRRENLGYSSEIPLVLIQAVLYIGVIAVTRLARPSLSKMCYNRRMEKNTMFLLSLLRIVAAWSILAAYTIPFFIIPRTVHPLLGWPLYLLGSFSLSSIVINIFFLHPITVLTTWFGFIGALVVMAFPWYLNGVVRALAVFAYAFCCAPLIWASLVKTMSSLQVLIERDAFRLGEPNQNAEFTKLY